MNGTSLSALLFVITGLLSSLYLLIEAALQAFGKSICPTEGCRIVAQYSRFGDLAMVLMGLGTVAVITVLAARGMRSFSAGRDRVINFLLVTSLAGEGFFVGYQLFRLNAVCIFCLSVFGIYVVLGGLRVLAGHREVLSGFGALLAVLSLFYLVLPAGGNALPLGQKYILFYSPDCKHCSEIRRELEEHKIEVRHIDVREYAPVLKNLGIEHVPTLLVNGPYEKHFLTGAEAIRRHVFTVPASQPAKKARPAALPGKGEAGMPSGQFNLFAPATGSNPIFNPLPDAGLCKENVKCD
jgi:glutaredoxin/uncharacterized membrane protein